MRYLHWKLNATMLTSFTCSLIGDRLFFYPLCISEEKSRISDMWCIEAQVKLQKKEERFDFALMFGGKITFSLTFKI